MDILKYISFSLLENIGQKSRSDYRGETQKFTILVSYIVANMKETKIQLSGFEMLEKQVNQSGNSGRVYVPIEWIGKKVKIILIEK